MLLNLLAIIMVGELVNVVGSASYNYEGNPVHPNLGEFVIWTLQGAHKCL
jgi:hypothetical protein